MGKIRTGRKKGRIGLFQLKGDIFDKLIVFGEQPFSETSKPQVGQGDYEIMISRILPFLREIFDLFEVITLVGRHR